MVRRSRSIIGLFAIHGTRVGALTDTCIFPGMSRMHVDFLITLAIQLSAVTLPWVKTSVRIPIRSVRPRFVTLSARAIVLFRLLHLLVIVRPLLALVN